MALNGRVDTHFVTTYDGYEHVGIHVADIEYVTYARHYVGIHTSGTTFIKRISLDKMVKQLSSRPFYIVSAALALPVDLLAAMDPGVHVIEREMFEYTTTMKEDIDKITATW